MIGQLASQYEAIAAAAGGGTDMTVVFDAGKTVRQLRLPGRDRPAVGRPASLPDLTTLPATVRSIVDEHRFGGLTAFAPAARSTAPSAGASPLTSCTKASPRSMHPLAQELDELRHPRPRKTRAQTDRDRRSPANPIRRWSPQLPRAAQDLRLGGHRPPPAALKKRSSQARLITDHDDWPATEVIPLPVPVRAESPSASQPPVVSSHPCTTTGTTSDPHLHLRLALQSPTSAPRAGPACTFRPRTAQPARRHRETG